MIQFDVLKGQVQTNMDTILGYIDNLSNQGVHLAVLPEMFSCSFDNKHLKDHSKKTDGVILQLSEIAKENKIAITGSLPFQIKDRIFNTMVFIDTDGVLSGSYQKLHLFKLTKEDHYYAAGNQVGVIDTSFGKIGLMICYDLRFPELARAQVLKDVEMILVCAQWPTPRVNHWQALLKARAIENQAYVIGTNRTGQEDGLAFPGMSMMVDPLGNIVSNAGDAQGIGWGDIDLEMVGKTRATIPCMTDRRPEIYG